MKLIILYVADIISIVWRIIPRIIRINFFFFINFGSRGDKKKGLKQLFLLKID